MESKIFLSIVFSILVLSLLTLYWFIPLSSTEFFIKYKGNNLSLNESEVPMQFYENMRFSSPKISYNIEGCPLSKKEDMMMAFEIISEKTILSFYEKTYDEEISITCQSRNKVEGGLFIAGEGGPVNITKSGEFNVIIKGKILLIKESTCPNPNIAIHELFHVLGFDHSKNKDDIMYSISSCDQEIDPASLSLINFLYSIPSYSDLTFENVSATMHGKYLNLNMSIRNNGLKDAEKSKVIIYADNNNIKEINVDALKIGSGKIISMTNIWVNQLSVKTIKLSIVTTYDELKKENNEVLLEVKK